MVRFPWRDAPSTFGIEVASFTVPPDSGIKDAIGIWYRYGCDTPNSEELFGMACQLMCDAMQPLVAPPAATCHHSPRRVSALRAERIARRRTA